MIFTLFRPGASQHQFGHMFNALKGKQIKCAVPFHDFTPQVVKSHENGTFWVNSTHFHENGWNLVNTAFSPPNRLLGARGLKNP